MAKTAAVNMTVLLTMVLTYQTSIFKWYLMVKENTNSCDHFGGTVSLIAVNM